MKKNNNSKSFKITLGCFAMMLLVSCGQDAVKDQINLIDDICQKILEYDFSVQEYPIDTSLYTAEVEAEFLEAFYEVVTNRIPLWYQGSVVRFFRDDLRGVVYLSDSEFVEREVKNIPYRLIDMDGDGLPELAMEVDWGICILKYNMEERMVTRYFGPLEGWKLLGSNRFGLHDTGSPHLNQNQYMVWDGQREIVQEFDFYMDSMYEIKCAVSGSGEINGGAAVSEEEWDVLTEDFFDAMESPVEFMTYEEVFGDVAEHIAERNDTEEAQQAYQEFLAGERSAENGFGYDTITEAGDLNGGVQEVECLIDYVTGDKIPELVIKTKERYHILTCRTGRLFVLLTLPADDYVLLEKGQVLYRSIQEDHEFYMCYQIQPSGTLYMGERFSRTDVNGDGIYDEADRYKYDDSDPFYRAGGGDMMQIVTMEEWMERIAQYLYVDENGAMQIIGYLCRHDAENLRWDYDYGC